MQYLKKFASTRLIFDNQQAYDALIKQLCESFVAFGISFVEAGSRQLLCTVGTCKEIIRRHCPATTDREVEYLVYAMQPTMEFALGGRVPIENGPGDQKLPQMISVEVFCMILAPYVSFIVADEDRQHVIDAKELKALLWLIRSNEPSIRLVDSFMKSLDRDHNGVLSCMEWVSYAIECDSRAGGNSLALATQVHLLFANADRNGDALLTLQELCTGLRPIIMQNLLRDDSPNQAQGDGNIVEKDAGVPKAAGTHHHRRQSQVEMINQLIQELANELMVEMDKNHSHLIEWYEFRQQLDYLERRIAEMKAYIREFVLA
ncbi:TPA: hypothetical protein N0F65_005084 [Lagenidium giganteum]|uniref:EF-hand domain-containing protein n=1 Tax=Lagenidium giganteum TaxID=4803 RepID=A0AAV2YCV1_9STRA|nr:TPA: hypothetical protein N0F65_005084 [Lagenidium giganteum]